MATLKFVAFIALLLLCTSYVRSEKVVIENNVSSTSKVETTSSTTKTTTKLDSQTEDLIKMCANREIKRCNDSKCNQVICSRNKGTYGCIPKGNNFIEYKTDVCNGVYKAAPKPKTVQQPNVEEFSLFMFASGVILVISIAVFVYSKLNTQQITMFNILNENDLESKRKGKESKYNEFSDLDETNSSFITRRNNYKPPVSALLE